jgi:exonuclease 3'-5' domain-containing protein 1
MRFQRVLEDPGIPKCVWDVRNDADALWALYHVGLASVTDIQLLENASRAGDKTYIRGLDKSVQFDLKLGFMEIHRWIRTKEVQSLMPVNAFAARPIDTKTAPILRQRCYSSAGLACSLFEAH